MAYIVLNMNNTIEGIGVYIAAQVTIKVRYLSIGVSVFLCILWFKFTR